jgi:hypothetical protein
MRPHFADKAPPSEEVRLLSHANVPVQAAGGVHAAENDGIHGRSLDMVLWLTL